MFPPTGRLPGTIRVLGRRLSDLGGCQGLQGGPFQQRPYHGFHRVSPVRRARQARTRSRTIRRLRVAIVLVHQGWPQVGVKIVVVVLWLAGCENRRRGATVGWLWKSSSPRYGELGVEIVVMVLRLVTCGMCRRGATVGWVLKVAGRGNRRRGATVGLVW